MLKRLRNIFRKTDSVRDYQLYNRRRFDSIISDKRFNYLDSTFKRLNDNDVALSDKRILEDYYLFSDQIQTNTIAAAELEFVIISVICYYRPNLTEQLLRRPLLCVVYCLGDEINEGHVMSFVKNRLLTSEVRPYGGLPPDNGIKWLAETLLTEKVLVQSVLKEVIRQNKEELNSI